MPCTSPMPAYRTPSGVSFQRREGFSDFGGLNLPCGQCLGCRLDKSRAWGVRCANEAQMHEHNCFVTRTYDDDHLPLDGSVSKRESQLFFKRLRHKTGPFRFLSCGEYGGRTRRPHYHDILFGISFWVDRYRWGTSKSGHPTYRSPLLESVWNVGHALIQDFHPDTGKYVASYTLKQTATNREVLNPETGQITELAPEFLLMSRRPGLGKGWWDKYQQEVISNEFIIINGTKETIPAFYLNKLPDDIRDQIKSNRRARANETAQRDEQLRAETNYGQDRLLTKHQLAILKNNERDRDLGEL